MRHACNIAPASPAATSRPALPSGQDREAHGKQVGGYQRSHPARPAGVGGLGLGQIRPPGAASGRWIALGPVWLRLGSRNSWQGEDEDAKMIKPVQP